IWNLDKDLPVSRVRSMDQLLSRSIDQPRFRTTLLGLFGLVALILSSVGIYGVISYSVNQRVQEIGIRMALGAQTKDVIRLILRQGIVLAVIGVAAGLTASLFLTSLMSSFLYDVSPTDPLTFAEVSLLLIVVALLACYIPAKRASRVDPMISLRNA